MDNPLVSYISRYYEKLRGGSMEAVLTRKAGSAVTINVIGAMVAVFVQILLARMLGATAFGEYGYALTWVMLLTVACKFGLDTATLRFLPQYTTTGQLSLLRGYVRWSSAMALGVSSAIAVVMVLVIKVQNPSEPDLQSVFYLAALVLPLGVYLMLQGSRLQAFQHIAWSQIPQIVLRPLFVAILVGMAIGLGGGPISAQTAMRAQVTSTLVCVVILLFGSRKVLPREIVSGENTYDRAMWTGVAVPMVLISGFDTLLNQTDVLAVGMLLNTTEAGVYIAASKISLLIPMPIIFVNSVIAPTIARLHTEGRTVQLQRMLTRVAWGSVAIAIPMCLGIIVCSGWLLRLFGGQFEAGQTTLIILTIGRLLVATTGSVGYLMSMSNHHREAATILGLTALVNIILCGLLVPRFGIEGAALSTSISMVSWSAIMVAVAYKLTGITATVFSPGFLGRRLAE